MSISLYHQAGHNAIWNIESFDRDSCGDGIIFSPVHQKFEQIQKIDEKIKERSIFDPQFYLPNSKKSCLHTYHFFPDVISDGFETADFVRYAEESARQCLEFQLESGFDKIVIPARFFEQMTTTYTEQQEAYTVEPFLRALKETHTDKNIYLTLPLTSHMIKDKNYRTSILNWVTSFPEIDGLYILTYEDRASKQTQDDSFIFNYLSFCHELQGAEYDIIIGYLNTEGLLFSLTQDIGITMGAYENTRMFSIDKFIDSNEGRRGPRPRIYLSGLFNWVNFNEAIQIRNALPKVWDKIYTPTTHADTVLQSYIETGSEPHFTQPALYKHFFEAYSDQVGQLSGKTNKECHSLLRKQIKSAQHYYSKIDEALIDLDRHGNQDHLQPWLVAINQYAREHLK